LLTQDPDTITFTTYEALPYLQAGLNEAR